MDKIILLITNEEDKPLERWIFALRTKDGNQILEGVDQRETERRFRDLMRKINIVDASLHPLDSEGSTTFHSQLRFEFLTDSDPLTFSIIVEMRDQLRLAADKVLDNFFPR